MKKEFRGTDGTPGFVSSWDSENRNVGKGEQEILKVTEGELIDYELRFLKPFRSVSRAYMKVVSEGDDRTKVQWGFSATMNYPSNIMLVFMHMEKVTGKDLEKGLQNLKALLEN